MNRTHAVRVHFSGQQRLRSSVCSLSKVAQFQQQGRQQCAIALALDCKFVYLKTANTCSCLSIVHIVIRQEIYDRMAKTNYPSFLLCSCPTISFLLNTERCFALWYKHTTFFMLAHIHRTFISLFHFAKPSETSYRDNTSVLLTCLSYLHILQTRDNISIHLFLTITESFELLLLAVSCSSFFIYIYYLLSTNSSREVSGSSVDKCSNSFTSELLTLSVCCLVYRYKAAKTLKQMLDFFGWLMSKDWGGGKVHYRPARSVD